MIILVVLLFYLTGFSLLSFFKTLQLSPLMRLGSAFGLGSGVVGLQLFVYSLLSIEWTVISVVLPLLTLLFLRRNHLHLRGFFVIKKRSLMNVDKLLVVLLSIVVLYTFVQASIHPVSSWDGIATWFFAAKAFFFERGVSSSFYQYANFEVPPLLPLQIVFIYHVTNSIAQSALLLFPFFFLNLLFVFYSSLKERLSVTSALFITLLLATTQPFLRQAGKFDVGHVDLPLAYYFLTAAVFLALYVVNKRWQTLLLAGVFAGLSAIVKNEGVSYFLVLVSIGSFIAVLHQQRQHILAFSIGALPLILWWLFRLSNPLPSHYLAESGFLLSRFPIILTEAAQEMFNIVRWHLLWILFATALIVGKKEKATITLFALVILQLLVYLGIYMVTPLDVIDHMKGSFDRLLMHLAPIALVSFAFTFSGIINSLFSPKHGKYS